MPRTFLPNKTRLLNKRIRHELTNPTAGLRFGTTNMESIHILVYSDASYASNDDLSSQIGALIFERNRCHVFDLPSRKSGRVACSMMSGVACAYLDVFYVAFAVLADARLRLGRAIEIHMFTNAKQLFDAMTHGRQSSATVASTEIF